MFSTPLSWENSSYWNGDRWLGKQTLSMPLFTTVSLYRLTFHCTRKTTVSVEFYMSWKNFKDIGIARREDSFGLGGLVGGATIPWQKVVVVGAHFIQLFILETVISDFHAKAYRSKSSIYNRRVLVEAFSEIWKQHTCKFFPMVSCQSLKIYTNLILFCRCVFCWKLFFEQRLNI